jgi:hypothetical protein
MKKYAILMLIFLANFEFCFAQDLPIIKANSKKVIILDGKHLRKNFWELVPETKIDVYEVENPRRPHRVSFYTDIDSIAVDIKFNETKDFIVVLNGRDSCYTRLSTLPKKPKPFYKVCAGCVMSNDTIPFTLSSDNANFITTKINDSEWIKFQVDLGSTACHIEESAANDCKMLWDGGTAEFGGVIGTQRLKVSNANKIQIGGLVWDSTKIFSANSARGNSKGFYGSSIFQDKILEINYDRNFFVVHSQLPAISKEYTKVSFDIRNGVIHIPVTIDNGITRATKWFIYDNGYSNCLLIDKEFATANKLYGTMKKVGRRSQNENGKTTTVNVPKLFIGDFQLNDVPIDLQNPDESRIYDNVMIGNDVLKRCNVIIDYQNYDMYIRPSKLLNTEYGKGEKAMKKIVYTGAVVLLATAGFFAYRKFK